MIRIVTKDSFDREKKPTPAKYIRAHPAGGVYFSAGLVSNMEIGKGDHVVYFFDEEAGEAFVARQNTGKNRQGWKLRGHGNHGLQFGDRYLVKKILEFFGGLEEGEKSMKIDVLPEPIERKEQHGYSLYRMVRR